MRELYIAGRRISDDEPAYLIAEIGHNHSGDLDRALQMVDTAIASGADAVKFQTRVPTEVYAKEEYFRTSDNPQWMHETYGKHREAIEFDHTQWGEVFSYCDERGITAFSTPFDFKSLELLAGFGVPAIKIASGDATNIPLIQEAAQVGVPLIISTGGCYLEDVDRIYETVTKTSTPFALLQCSCIYPAPNDVLNLRVISDYRSRYPDVVCGLSTHARDWTPTLAAFGLGGRIFEHHYTNDQQWKGTDNHFSLTPEMFSQLRDAVDTVLPALGSSLKTRDPREESYTVERQKKLVWARDMKKGQIIVREDISIKCPGNGIAPYRLGEVLGQQVTEDAEADTGVSESQIREVRKVEQKVRV